MSTPAVRAILLATALALAGCGGGGGGLASAGSTPPPWPPPPPPPPPPGAAAIIPAATTSQQFAAMGAVSTDFAHPGQLDAAEQLQVRYVESTNSYEVQLPHSEAWLGVQYVPLDDYFVGNSGAFGLSQSYGNYQYSRHFVWQDGERIGTEAIGIPTPPSGVPITGSATYAGQLHGFTTEAAVGVSRFITGTFSSTFNFATGSLSGNFSPILNDNAAEHSIGTVNFRDTVYSTGSPTFSGRFESSLPGTNGFSGQFTGPHAEELIGNFAFPYQSPLNGQPYEATGAFVGAK